MKFRRSSCWATIVLVAAMASAGALMAQSDNQSLGEYARKARRGGSSASAGGSRVYDNDNLPTDSTVSVVGHEDSGATTARSENDDRDQAKPKAQDKEPTPDKDAPPNTESKSPANTESKSPAKDSEARLQPGQSADERQKTLQVWKEKLAGQKEKIDLLSRELDVVKGEYRLKAAQFYADAARRIQNPYGFAADDARYKQQIADKEKELDDAKAKLADMQEEARRQGAPNSVIE